MFDLLSEGADFSRAELAVKSTVQSAVNPPSRSWLKRVWAYMGGPSKKFAENFTTSAISLKKGVLKTKALEKTKKIFCDASFFS